MKLILAIINRDDAGAVTQNLTKQGFSSTKLSTTGGFLMSGNVTILVGVDEEKVQEVIDIIKEQSHSRRQVIPTTTEMSYGYYPSMPVEVTVGGATIFVVDIERFERV
ncbi:MAG: cyclic-di-AMP receptor [Clostridiales bacterium]|nr:cyclic-di-AMP receptor [Clostridiales bacterium]